MCPNSSSLRIRNFKPRATEESHVYLRLQHDDLANGRVSVTSHDPDLNRGRNLPVTATVNTSALSGEGVECKHARLQGVTGDGEGGR